MRWGELREEDLRSLIEQARGELGRRKAGRIGPLGEERAICDGVNDALVRLADELEQEAAWRPEEASALRKVAGRLKASGRRSSLGE